MKTLLFIFTSFIFFSNNTLAERIDAPSISRVYEVEGSQEKLYGDYLNSHQGKINLYYIPKGTSLEKINGKSVFSFLPRRNGEATTSFRVNLEPSNTIANKINAIKEKFAILHETSIEKINVKSLPLYDIKIEMFDSDDFYQTRILPPDNIVDGSSLPFFFNLTNDGARWFKNEIIKNKFLLASLNANTRLWDEIAEEFIEARVNIPLYLDTVPYCAVTALGCGFDF